MAPSGSRSPCVGREVRLEAGAIGDDNFVTDPKFIARGIKEKTANAALIKLNQIDTVTETIQAIALCRKAGWAYVASHRSGETEDAFLAEFTVAMCGGQIKTGSLSRSERVGKYNRLLEIEAELGKAAQFASPFAYQTAPSRLRRTVPFPGSKQHLLV